MTFFTLFSSIRAQLLEGITILLHCSEDDLTRNPSSSLNEIACFDTLRHTYEFFLVFIKFQLLNPQKNLGSEVCLWVIFQCCAAALQQQTISLDGQQQKLSVSTPCLHRGADILCFRYFR